MDFKKHGMKKTNKQKRQVYPYYLDEDETCVLQAEQKRDLDSRIKAHRERVSLDMAALRERLTRIGAYDRSLEDGDALKVCSGEDCNQETVESTLATLTLRGWRSETISTDGSNGEVRWFCPQCSYNRGLIKEVPKRRSKYQKK